MSPEGGDTNDSVCTGRGEPCPSGRVTKDREQGQPAVPAMVAVGWWHSGCHSCPQSTAEWQGWIPQPSHNAPEAGGGGDTNPGPPRSSSAPQEAAPNLPQTPLALGVRNFVPQPPVPGRVLGHAGDSQGRWHSLGWLLSLPVVPAAQGLARSPRGIFIPEFVLFEAVSSVFSVINTNPPLSQPGSELTATATPSAATA